MRLLASLAGVWFLAAISGCSPSADQASTPVRHPKQVLDFGVYWPPQDPAAPEGPVGEPLLVGQLQIWEATSLPGNAALTLSVELTRPDDEEHREIWNARLAYREFDWMRRVRVWDADEKWLWPNLPYLLRAHGKRRIERYGGIDPGKGVDNDFAAVLIRAYDATGNAEHPATENAPLVSAEWRPVGVENTDGQTVVHTARSDEFTLPIGNTEPERGRLGVWLIYADFLGAPAPLAWPNEPEWAGGILAYFQIDWSVTSNGECRLSMQQKTPPNDTGFDWEEWIGPNDRDERERAVARLSCQQ